MHYRAIQPHPRLAKYLECFWTLEGSSQPAAISPEAIMPDGCIELIFNLADPFKRYHGNNKIEMQPATLLAGQMQRFAMIAPTGRVKLFGIRFHPGGAYPFLQLPLNELTDQIINFENVANRLGRELMEKIETARSLRERLRIVETVFLARLDSRYETARTVRAAVALMIQKDGMIPIERLQQIVGVSARQLERQFQTQVGLTPKFFSRLLRFQKVFKVVTQNHNLGWSFIATECGYYDQAHFIHDFKTFSGQNPVAYFREDHQMAEHFTRKKRIIISH